MKKLNNLLEKFLAKKVKIKSGNDSVEIAQEDVHALQEIIEEITHLKWEKDYEDLIPLQINVINTHLYEKKYYRPVPRIEDKEPKFLTNFAERFRAVTHNLSIASKDMERLESDFESTSRANKAIDEGRYCSQHGAFKDPGPCPICKKIFSNK